MGEAGVGRMLLSLDYEAADAAAEAALAFAGPCQAISLGIEVEPSTEPASLVLLHQGEPLPQKPLVCCLQSSHSSRSSFIGGSSLVERLHHRGGKLVSISLGRQLLVRSSTQ